LHRWAVIAEGAHARLTPAERGVVVRAIAARPHTHPDGAERRYGRSTIHRWIRDWRAGGLAALRPQPRSDSGLVRARPELFEEAVALRLELPTRSAAQIAEIVWARHRVRVSPRPLRDQLRRRGLHREALAAEPKVFGRYEAARPNERWITDVLVDPWVPFPRTPTSIRARLFVIVDDHSRLLVHGRFHAVENTRAGQETLRAAIVRRGLPEVLYADRGAPFANHTLARTCAVLGIRLVHSQPYSPEGRGKQERLNRYIRERFVAEAEHAGIADLAELNDRFEAWDQLNAFAGEVTRVAREVGVEGKLGGQAQSKEVGGVWKDLTDNVNQLAANLTNQVRAISEVATAVTEGDLTRQVSGEARGEVAVLKDKLNEMIRNLRETTRQNIEQDWLKTNRERFTRMLQGQRDLATVSNMILSELAPLVLAQHAVFYSTTRPTEGSEPMLRLQASYGYEERRHLVNFVPARRGTGRSVRQGAEADPAHGCARRLCEDQLRPRGSHAAQHHRPASAV
jgi:transposase InsO family protein